MWGGGGVRGAEDGGEGPRPCVLGGGGVLSGSPYIAMRVMGGHVAIIWSPDGPSFVIRPLALSIAGSPWYGPCHTALAAVSLGCFVPAPHCLAHEQTGFVPPKHASQMHIFVDKRKNEINKRTHTFVLAFTEWSELSAAASPHHRTARHTETYTDPVRPHSSSTTLCKTLQIMYGPLRGPAPSPPR